MRCHHICPYAPFYLTTLAVLVVAIHVGRWAAGHGGWCRVHPPPDSWQEVMMRARQAIAVLSLFGVASAHASNPTITAFQAFGLLGQWSPDCRRPPSADNPRVFYDITGTGLILHSVTNDGRTVALSDTASDAAILADDLIRFSVVRDGKLSLIVTLQRVAGKIRTIDSVGADGTHYYSNGLERSSGKRSMMFERCDAQSFIS